tara:strand:- start:422 stop:760 length:339 start_codon:yes stop_codon:yes gene_type:complete
MSEQTIYYLKPNFKGPSLLVPVLLIIPIGFIIGHIAKGDSENFQNKDLENAIIQKHENIIIKTEDEVDDEDDWDITEYMNDKYNELKNYIKKINVINNDNGNKSINVRYNIE